MVKVLIIKAHPEMEKQSNSMAMVEDFKQIYQQSHPKDEIIEHNVSDGLDYPLNSTAISIYNKNMAQLELTPEEKTFQEGRQKLVGEFMNADKYVFANPMYNLFIPAEMKTYFDIVMQVPYTFHYTENGPEGLLENKKAIHLQSNGGLYHSGPVDLSHLDIGDRYIKTVLGVMGVTDVQSFFAEGMDYDPEHAEDIMSAAMEKIAKAAEEF